MKKFTMMVVVALMATVGIYAQDGYEDSKHEIGISYGALSNSTWQAIGESMGTSIASVGSIRYDDGDIIGAIGLEYFYHVSPVIGVGAVGTYTRETKNLYFGNNKSGDAKNTFISVLPAVKFNWLRKKYLGMYSKVAAGVTFTSKKEEYTRSDTENRSENKVNFNWQASAFGLEAGSPYIRAFIELGVGEQGVALTGIRFKF